MELHRIDDDLGEDGYAWLDTDAMIGGFEQRLVAEDAMDAHEQADFLVDDDR